MSVNFTLHSLPGCLSTLLEFHVITVTVARMSHWKWRETKQPPGRARSGHQISCCFVSLHFLCDILATIMVYYGNYIEER